MTYDRNGIGFKKSQTRYILKYIHWGINPVLLFSWLDLRTEDEGLLLLGKCLVYIYSLFLWDVA